MNDRSHATADGRGRLAQWAAGALLGFACTIASAAQMSWTATSYLVKSDPKSGVFERRGVAMFKNGDLAPFTMQGQFLSAQGNSAYFQVRIVYTFDDQSTLVQEGTAKMDREPNNRSTQAGSGRLVSGTGRFAGISGTTQSTGRGLNASDSYTAFTAEYTGAKP